MLRRRAESNAVGYKEGEIGDLAISYRGEKKVKLEGDTAKVAPLSANPPPTAAPPAAYSRDRVRKKEWGEKEKTPKESRAKEKGNPKDDRRGRK